MLVKIVLNLVSYLFMFLLLGVSLSINEAAISVYYDYMLLIILPLLSSVHMCLS